MNCARMRGLKSAAIRELFRARARRRFTATTSCSRTLVADGNDITSVAEICAGPSARRGRSATIGSAVKDAALRGDRRRARSRAPRDPRRQRARPAAARDAGLSAALLDRLRSTRARSRDRRRRARRIAALPDPVGEVIDGCRLPNGLDVRKVRVPLGVVAVVYEARPNVTIDAAALCLKSGNAIVLRGSSLGGALERGARRGSPRRRPSAPGCRTGASRSSPAAAARSSPSSPPRRGIVDLIIPRGGEGLKDGARGVATVPVIYAASGNCHVYVDAAADLDAAAAIVLNAKIQRPGVCNAAETLLVHARRRRRLPAPRAARRSPTPA